MKFLTTGFSPTETRKGFADSRILSVIGLTSVLLVIVGWIESTRAQTEPPELDFAAYPLGQAVEDFETDSDRDGVPDVWYNQRDCRLIEAQGTVGATVLRFENARPGRPSRLSRAFEVDGRQIEALEVSLQVRLQDIALGERIYERPKLMIDFFDESLRAVGHAELSGWDELSDRGWQPAGQRIPVHSSARDAILTVGLLGSTGILDLDGLRIDVRERGGLLQSNVVPSGDFEFVTPGADRWQFQGGARRVTPGYQSSAGLMLDRAGATATTALAYLPSRRERLRIRVQTRAKLGRFGSATLIAYPLNERGRPLRGREQGKPVMTWQGSFDWSAQEAEINLPRNTDQVALQFRLTREGAIQFDDLEVAFLKPGPGDQRDPSLWIPGQLPGAPASLHDYSPVDAIVPGSPLDASRWLDPLNGLADSLEVEGNQFQTGTGRPVRFLGATLIPPLATNLRESESSELADRMATHGLNLARITGWDMPLGPGQSLIDEAQETTTSWDPNVQRRLVLLINNLRKRGIRVAVDLLSHRKLSPGDLTRPTEDLPFGIGPVSAFDPEVRTLLQREANQLFNLEVGPDAIPLGRDAALAWVTLSNQQSLVDLGPRSIPEAFESILDRQRTPSGGGRRLTLATLERDGWSDLANRLRDQGVRAPIAAVSHWQRDSKTFVESWSEESFDLVDDRFSITPDSLAAPERRSLLWEAGQYLLDQLEVKQTKAKPYVLGEWAWQTGDAQNWPYQGADLLWLVMAARQFQWQGVILRGVGLQPRLWGQHATATRGGGDLTRISGSIGADPQVLAALPHAAALMMDQADDRSSRTRLANTLANWSAERGQLAIATSKTQGLVGWWRGQGAVDLPHLKIRVNSPFAIVLVTALDRQPLGSSRRILISAFGRFSPQGLRWWDQFLDVPLDRGRPGFRQEPIDVAITWKRPGLKARGAALDLSGKAKAPVTLEPRADGVRLLVRPQDQTIHWVVEAIQD